MSASSAAWKSPSGPPDDRADDPPPFERNPSGLSIRTSSYVEAVSPDIAPLPTTPRKIDEEDSGDTHDETKELISAAPSTRSVSLGKPPRDAESDPVVDSPLSPDGLNEKEKAVLSKLQVHKSYSLEQIDEENIPKMADIVTKVTNISRSDRRRRREVLRKKAKQTEKLLEHDPSWYTDDPIRKENAFSHCLSTGEPIDIVLVGKLPINGTSDEELWLKDPNSAQDCTAHSVTKKEIKSAKRRGKFERKMLNLGLQLERVLSKDGLHVFTLVHAPAEFLVNKMTALEYVAEIEEDQIRKLGQHADAYLDKANFTDYEDDGVRAIYNRYRRRFFRSWNSDRPEELSVFEGVDLSLAPKYYMRFDNTPGRFVIDEKNVLQKLPATERTFLLNDSLSKIKVEDKKDDEGKPVVLDGIQAVLDKGAYEDMYMLHDGPLAPNPKKSRFSCRAKQVDNTAFYEGLQRKRGGIRERLSERWASLNVLLKSSPLDDVRDYIGNKWALYFLFLGDYTANLVFPSILGLVTFLIGVGSIFGWGDTPADVELVCNAKCDGPQYLDTERCGLTNISITNPCDNLICGIGCSDASCYKGCLSDQCIAQSLSYAFDNWATIAFTLLIAIWSMFALDVWKRTLKTYQFRWGLNERFESNRTRPKFKGSKKRPVRFAIEKFETFDGVIKRMSRYAAATTALVSMMVLLCVIYISITVFRTFARIRLAQVYDSDLIGSLIASVIASIFNLTFILALNDVYKYIAIQLTEWENHRTRVGHENALTWKVFLFQFVNTNIALFYVGVIKPFYANLTCGTQPFFGGPPWPEPCASYGCRLELSVELLIIMIGKQYLQNLKETYLPRISTWYSKFTVRQKAKKNQEEREVSRNRKSIYTGNSDEGTIEEGETSTLEEMSNEVFSGGSTRIKGEELLPWENDFENLAPNPDMDTFEDFLELSLQFGFCTMYVSAFTLAPIFALINNVYEKQVDSSKILRTYRRPIPKYTAGIGVWEDILTTISVVGVIIQGLVLACTSEIVPIMIFRSYFKDVTYPLTGFEPYTNKTVTYTTANYRYDYNKQCSEKTTCENIVTADGNIIIGFTEYSYYLLVGRIILFLIFEHVVILLKLMVNFFLPVESVSLARHKQVRDRVVEKVLNDGIADDDDDDDDYNSDGISLTSTPSPTRRISGGAIKRRAPALSTRARTEPVLSITRTDDFL